MSDRRSWRFGFGAFEGALEEIRDLVSFAGLGSQACLRCVLFCHIVELACTSTKTSCGGKRT